MVIQPGEMVLGITREKITLADNISGRLEGRSRFARFGLAVHVTAGFMHPGISNHQVLEIVNLGHAPLALYPDTRICQFVFEDVTAMRSTREDLRSRTSREPGHDRSWAQMAALTTSPQRAIPISNETRHQLKEALSWRKRNPRNLPSRMC